jgi:hypothetical protein
MTPEEQIKVKKAWARLRAIAKFGPALNEQGVANAQEAAQEALETLRSLVSQAYDMGAADCEQRVRENAYKDLGETPPNGETSRDGSIQGILDSLDLGLEV